jgi:hypothetical protein
VLGSGAIAGMYAVRSGTVIVFAVEGELKSNNDEFHGGLQLWHAMLSLWAALG